MPKNKLSSGIAIEIMLDVIIGMLAGNFGFIGEGVLFGVVFVCVFE
ncbi:hypothetical protein [Flavobacterium sp. SOK18b]|nr:hypothetical protein [Flavobacterium sp. SOK18b]